MSVATEDEKCTIAADLGRVAITGTRRDRNNAVAYVTSSWRETSRVWSHGLAHSVNVGAQLSLLHLLVVGIEALIGVLNYETGLHGH